MINLLDASKKDNQWRLYALKITGNKNEADEVVQEMYVKLSKVKKKVNDSYILMMIKTVFLDRQKKKKRIIYAEDDFLNSVEIKDEDSTDVSDEKLDQIESLPFHQKQLLIESYDKSLRQIQNEFNINYGFVYREIKKAKEKILGNGK